MTMYTELEIDDETYCYSGVSSMYLDGTELHVTFPHNSALPDIESTITVDRAKITRCIDVTELTRKEAQSLLWNTAIIDGVGVIVVPTPETEFILDIANDITADEEFTGTLSIVECGETTVDPTDIPVR